MAFIICGCGNKLEYKGEEVICGVCQNKNLFCPECKASISIPKNAIAVSCPYCNATLLAKDIKDMDEKLFFPTAYNKSECLSKFQWFLLNRFGIPEDIKVKFTPKDIKLHYIPISIYDIKATLTPEIIERDIRGIIAADNIKFKNFIRDYRFAVKSKIYYKADEIKGKVYQPDVSRKVTEKTAKDIGVEMARSDMKRFDINTSPDIEIGYLGTIYYPFYEIVYAYDGKEYNGVTDASNGIVCYAEYPISPGTRNWLKIAGISYALISFIIGIVEGIVFGNIISLLIVWLQGLVIGAVIFFSASSVKKEKEVIKTSDKKLIVKYLDKSIDSA